ncbi:hypothetical protein ACHAPJ_010518 [Fusarium lateritium]
MTRTLLTTLDDYVADIIAAATFIVRRHPEAPPMVLVGHSFGGGHLQYLLAYQGQNGPSLIQFGGLVLLASAPLSGGGKQITANWEKVEAPIGYKYPWSPRSQLETPDQVRAAFFQPETDDEVIKKWLNDCRTVKEGIRTGISVFWPFGEARYVLKNLVGLQCDSGQSRKVLLVAASEDRLVKPALVEENAKAYEIAVGEASESGQPLDTNEVVMSTSIPGSAHHLMMDLAWEVCFGRIIDWAEGRNLQN